MGYDLVIQLCKLESNWFLYFRQSILTWRTPKKTVWLNSEHCAFASLMHTHTHINFGSENPTTQRAWSQGQCNPSHLKCHIRDVALLFILSDFIHSFFFKSLVRMIWMRSFMCGSFGMCKLDDSEYCSYRWITFRFIWYVDFNWKWLNALRCPILVFICVYWFV